MKTIQFFKNLFRRRKFCGKWKITAFIDDIICENGKIVAYILKNSVLGITYIIESKSQNLPYIYHSSNNHVELIATVKKTSKDNKIWYIDVCDK